MYTIKVEGEGTLPRTYATVDEAIDAYSTLHVDHAKAIGKVTICEVVPITMADLIPNLRGDIYQRMGEMHANTAVLDEWPSERWDDLQDFMRECAQEWARLSEVVFDDVRVVESTVTELSRG